MPLYEYHLEEVKAIPECLLPEKGHPDDALISSLIHAESMK